MSSVVLRPDQRLYRAHFQVQGVPTGERLLQKRARGIAKLVEVAADSARGVMLVVSAFLPLAPRPYRSLILTLPPPRPVPSRTPPVEVERRSLASYASLLAEAR